MQPCSINAPANLLHYAVKPFFHFFSEKLSSFIFKMDKNKCPKFFCEPTFFSGKGRISTPYCNPNIIECLFIFTARIVTKYYMFII